MRLYDPDGQSSEFIQDNLEKIMKNILNLMLLFILGCCSVGISAEQSKIQKDKFIKAHSPAIQKQKTAVPRPGKLATPEPPRSTAPEVHFLAEIRLFAGNFSPMGWRFCEGQILSINNNQRLYSLLGTTYGGDGRTTFALPDLSQAEIPFRTRPNRPNSGPRYIISIAGSFPKRP
jgi:hypothetical protein